MRNQLLILLITLLLPLTGLAQEDTVHFYKLESSYPVDKTVERVKMEITKRNLQVFTIIDHSLFCFY